MHIVYTRYTHRQNPRGIRRKGAIAQPNSIKDPPPRQMQQGAAAQEPRRHCASHAQPSSIRGRRPGAMPTPRGRWCGRWCGKAAERLRKGCTVWGRHWGGEGHWGVKAWGNEGHGGQHRAGATECLWREHLGERVREYVERALLLQACKRACGESM